jgi:hypothetical protein
MFNEELLDIITETFVRDLKVDAQTEWVTPCIYLQSNVEDVSITMRSVVEKINSKLDITNKYQISAKAHDSLAASNAVFLPVSHKDSTNSQLEWVSTLPGCDDSKSDVCDNISQRMRLWIAEISKDEKLCKHNLRAIGQGWLSTSILPGNARTETEAYCSIEKKPVHRILFEFR